jgi:hypothetical protein
MDESVEAGRMSVFMLAGMGGALPAEDLELYVKTFGAATTCTFADGRVLSLKKIPASKNGPEVNPMDEVFSGALDQMFEWLDACARLNFGSLIEKTRAGLASVDPAKAEPKVAQ